jgi:hypothetical protein
MAATVIAGSGKIWSQALNGWLQVMISNHLRGAQSTLLHVPPHLAVGDRHSRHQPSPRDRRGKADHPNHKPAIVIVVRRPRYLSSHTIRMIRL